MWMVMVQKTCHFSKEPNDFAVFTLIFYSCYFCQSRRIFISVKYSPLKTSWDFCQSLIPLCKADWASCIEIYFFFKMDNVISSDNIKEHSLSKDQIKLTPCIHLFFKLWLAWVTAVFTQTEEQEGLVQLWPQIWTDLREIARYEHHFYSLLLLC